MIIVVIGSLRVNFKKSALIYFCFHLCKKNSYSQTGVMQALKGKPKGSWLRQLLV